MHRFAIAIFAISSTMFVVPGCHGSDQDGVNEYEYVGQSERAGIGMAEQPLVLGTVTVDARRSLAITEQAIVDGFTLQAVLDQLATQSGIAGLTGTQLFKQLWDTQNPRPGLTNGPHCNDSTTMNGFPYGCRPAEGAQAQNPSVEMAKYKAIGLFNRFDLASSSGADCGEYRIVFARTPENGKRNFIVFEAILGNPHPEFDSLEGCRAITKFWANLSANSDVAARKNALLAFYFQGLDGVMPVVHFENLGTLGDGRTTTGQVRTNQFLQSPWTLREFKLQKTCSTNCTMFFQPATDKTNPFGRLFSANMSGALATEFQNTFFPSQIASLAINDVNGFSYSVPDKYNTGESSPLGTMDVYSNQFSATGTLATNIQSKLTEIGSSLTPQHIVARAQALSCAGCHALSNQKPMGGGLTWPSSLGFTHISETATEAGPDGTRYVLSAALNSSFLPHRKLVLENFLNSSAIHSAVARDRCLDVSGGSSNPETNVQSWECNGTEAQRWILTPSGELRSAVGANLCLEVENNRASRGTNLQINTCNGTNGQKFSRTATGELRSTLAASLCVDVSGSSRRNGANVQLWNCNGTKAQRWFEQPTFPVENLAGAPITIRNVRLDGKDGTDSNVMVDVRAGKKFSMEVDYTILQSTTCATCTNQILVGIGSAAQGCVYEGTPTSVGTSGTGTIELTAPTTPGVYYIRFHYGQAGSCDLNGWTLGGAPTDKDNIAVITVN